MNLKKQSSKNTESDFKFSPTYGNIYNDSTGDDCNFELPFDIENGINLDVDGRAIIFGNYHQFNSFVEKLVEL